MKIYSLKRSLLFSITAKFPAIQLTRCGSLFVEAVLTDSQAQEINAAFPESVTLLNP